MKGTITLLLCAVALAQGFHQIPVQRSSGAHQICQATYDNDNVLVAHENCNQFYKCNHGKAVAFKCYGNLRYNPYTGQCDWPVNVDCGDRVIPDQRVSVPSVIDPLGSSPDNICPDWGAPRTLVPHENCNQFYRCVYNVPVLFTCPDGLLYDPVKGICDWPSDVDCGDRVIPDPDQSVTNPPGTTPEATIPGNNGNPSEAPAICAADGSDGVLVAHEKCNQFYKCSEGKPVAFLCPNGLLFNPTKDQCDWPFNVNCGDRVIPDQRVSVPSVFDPLGTSPLNICAPSDVPKFLLPHENCNQFYMCVINAPVVFTCPEGLVFDPAEGQCDWPSNVDCGDRVIPDPDQSVTNPPGTTPGATIPGNNGNPSEAPAICAADGSDGVLVAHEKCNQFYKCSEGKPVALLCPSGLLFNPANDQCDWLFNVYCGDRVIPDPDQSVTNPDVSNPALTNPPATTPGAINPGNNCNPSEAPAICAAYGSDGVLVAHQKCNQFYKCSEGKPVALLCPSGLLFNPAKDQCDWPFNVDCGDRVIPSPDQSVTNPAVTNPPLTNPPATTPGAINPGNNCNPSEAPAICSADGSDGVLVAHEKCNQFYKCSEGKPVALLCPSGLLFNPANDQCDWPFNVDCGDRVIPSPDQIVSTPAVINPPVTNPPATTPGATNPGNNCNPSEAPAICAADGSDGVLVAHEKCNQFYKCSEGKPVALLCPSGLLFNPAKDQCDWPFNVDCGDRVIPSPDQSVTNPAVTNPPLTNPPATTPGAINPGNNCNPSEAPAICSADGSDGVLVAHEKCNQFYKCSEGKPVALLCPSGLLFNPANDQCDWPFNVDCGDRVIPSPDQIVSTPAVINPPVTNPPATTPGATNPGNNCNPSEAPAICAADGSDGVLVAHEKCNQFYKCSEGKPVALLCPSGLLFNPAKDQCDWPFNVDCGDRVIPDPDQSVTNPDVSNPPLTNPPATTPGAINPGNNCNPSEAPAICAADDSDGVLVAHEKCNQFYKCSEGKPVALLCPSGLLFNPAKDQCDWPFNVDCGDRVIPDPDQSVTNPAVSNPPLTNPPATTPGAINPGNNCNPNEAPAICAADGSDGVLVAHEKCNQFYKCSEGKPVALLCPSGLLFNPAKDQCDWPFNVDCGDRVIPNPDQSVTNPAVTNPPLTNPPLTNPPATTPGAINPGNNCNPSEAPAICSADGSDGVLVAHEKCNQFYKCSEGKPVALLCPSGLLFNPANDQCDWPFNVDCGDRVIPSPDQIVSTPAVINPPVTNPPATTPGATNPGNNCNPSKAPAICAADGSDGVLVAHEKCNQFYKCSEGKPVALLCPSGLLFNPAKDQCDWPFNVDCGDRVIPSPDQSVTNPAVTNPPLTNPPATTPGAINPGNNCNPSEAPAICSADGSDGVLVAHEKCNQFYKCSEGKPVALLCPSGLLFNPANDQCDWPFNVDCGDRVIPSPDQIVSTPAVINPPVTNPPATTPGATNPGNNCNPSEAPAICAADGSDGVLVAHEKCNQFYKCSEGKPVALLCPSGLLFNPANDQCDWPFNVDCGDRVIPSPDQIVSTPAVINPPVTNPPATTPGATNPGNNCNPSEAPAICAADGSDGVLVAHEKCNQFYKCSEGKPVALLCPSGLLFNPAKDQCDWPFNVDCGDRVIPDPDQSVTNPDVSNPPLTNPPATTPGAINPGNNCNPSEAPAICAADGSDGVLVAHEKCNQFYKCSEGKPVAFLCPNGLLFNPTKDQCDWPFNVNCGDRVIPDQRVSVPSVFDPLGTSPLNICAPSDVPKFLLPHENCNQFYMCVINAPVVFTCPEGLVFDPAEGQCDWPSNVDCGDRVIPDPDQSVTNPPGTTPGATIPGNNGYPSEAPAICAADGSDGVLVAHEKCNQFYKCSEGKPVALLCPSGLLFNPANDQCDWPFNVYCGDRVIPDPDQSVTNPDVSNPALTNPPATTPGAINPGNNCNPSEAPAICAAYGSDGVLVAHQKCNQFYKCSEGKPVALLCPSGLLFNPAKDQCDWPFNVDCGDRVIPSPDQSVTNPAVTNPPLTNPPATTPGAINPGNNCNPSEAPAICSADGSDGVLVAHEKCNQFYKCSEGKPVALLCPSGLLFNPANDQCDWPFNVDCGDRVIPSPDQIVSTPAVINPPVTNPPATTPGATNPGNNCNPSEAPAICAADGSDGVLVAHEKCNQFYKCSEGKPVALLCPSGLLFNPAKDQCDWPFNVDCGDRVIPSPDQSVTNPAVTNPPLTNPPATTPGAINPGNNCNPSEAPAICSADGSDGVLVAHEKCNQFYKCSEGKPVALLCPSGLLFNPANDQCDWPFNVDCGDRVIPSPDQIVSTPAVINPPVTNPPATTPGATNPGNNCNPSEAPAICAADGSDGVLVAHEKCNQFYKCSEGKPVALLCPSGLLFNPAKDQCDWPFNVDCGDRVIPDPDQSVTNPDVSNPPLTNPPATTPGAINPGNNCNPSEAPAICAADDSDGVLVAHEKCNQFYKCSEGKPVALLCPSGLLFNPAKDQCDWPFNVDCGDRVIPDPDQSVTNPAVSNPPLTNPPATTPGAINPGNNCNPNEAPAICAADGSDGVLVAHEKCNQFYKCSEGKPVALLCPSGLLFNPAKDQCDWPFNVDCGDRVIPNPDQSVTNPAVTNPPLTNPPLTNPPATTPGAINPGNNCNPSEAPAICSADGSDGVLVAHEKCNQFYKCSEGKPVALLCPSGLLFNPANDQCDWPFNVDCGDRVIPSPDLIATTPGVINPPVTNPPATTPGAISPGNNCNPSEAPAICAADGSDGVLVAHEKCNQFYKCSEGKPVALLCPSGLLFNPAKDQCDWPFYVDCGDRVIQDPDQSVTNPAVTNQPGTNPGASNPGNNGNPSEAPAICAADGSDGVLVAHEKCNQFYKCSEGKPVALLCPSGLLFNPANDQCDWPFNVNCGDRVIPDPDQSVTNPPRTTPGATIPGNNGNPSEAPAICAADGSDGVLVAHEKCNQFYKCSEGKPVALLCPSGLLFNPANDQCDWPFNVDCGDRVIPSPDQSVLNPAVTNQPGTNLGASNPGNNGNPSEAPAICAADGSDGVLVAHEKCNQFYKCSEGKPVALLCPSGLMFNPANDQCDWPFNVDCGDRVIPDPDQSVTNPPGTTPGATIPGNNGNPSEAPAICAADGSDGVLVAHEKCNQFYQCSEGKPVALLCPSGLLFNPAKDQCDWPWNVECGNRIIPYDCAYNPKNAQSLCSQPGSQGKLIAHENCYQFYICSHSVPVAQTCPAGLFYNKDREFCDWPQNVNCDNRILSLT